MIIQLIVGLANPGKTYEKTRHNAGAWVIEALAKRHNISLHAESKFHGLHGDLNFNGSSCHLLIPSTFMNHSGQAVRAFMQFHKIEPTEILVIHDEIDLPVGISKLKFAGGDGGHNGLRNIIAHLHTKSFWRLRIGVGRPQTSEEVVDYVLQKPSKHERTLIDETIATSLTIFPLIMQNEMQKAMHQLHTEKK